jgi:LemA protein
MSPILIIVVVLLVLAAIVVMSYNRLVSMRQNVKRSWADIDAELRRRHDLVPNLVETVKGYAAHESQTLENVIRARNAAIAAPSATATGVSAEAVRNENQLTGALRQIFALSESYPDLKADANFRQLQGELSQIEDKIASSRKGYNAGVQSYNTAIESFPSSLIAGNFGFTKEEFFEIEDPAVRDAPVVRF